MRGWCAESIFLDHQGLGSLREAACWWFTLISSFWGGLAMTSKNPLILVLEAGIVARSADF